MARERRHRMAGIITIAPGHDASYPWRQIGTSDRSPEPGRAGTSYYLAPADKGGEPPGRWQGGGVADLGFREGQVIEREVFERLYGKFLDPRDPSGETRLGRAPQRFRCGEEIFQALLALEPEATAERRAQLMVEAKSQVRAPVQYFDATFSVSKSITLLHASAMANAARAAAAGDLEAVAYWEQAAADVWACVQAGNRAGLEYLQREAGYTRSGYHGRQAGEVRTGRWEDAHGFIVGSFAQHTSRDGDPQLHIHNLILNRVMRESDGAYRTLDSRALHEHRGAAAAIATLVMESALSREFGTGWVAAGGRARPGGPRGQRGADGRVLLPPAEHLGADRPARRRVPGPARLRAGRPGARRTCASGPITRAGSASPVSHSTWPPPRGGGRRRRAPATRAHWSRSCPR